MNYPEGCRTVFAFQPGQIAQPRYKHNRHGEKITLCGRSELTGRLGLLILVLAFCGGTGKGMAAALPSCFPPIEVAHAKIVRVERNGVLVLKDGRAAVLEGILLPAGAADRAPDTYASRSVGRLVELAVGQSATLAAEAPKEDRYGRLRAQVLVVTNDGTKWLQRTLLAEGLARVDIAPDRNDCAAELYASEARAREARAGLWNDSAYSVLTPMQAAGAVDTFQIVAGTIARVSGRAGRTLLEFRADAKHDFAIVITPDDSKTFHAIGVDPYSYEGETVRVRGWIERTRFGSEIDVATPSDIEIVRSPVLRGSLSAPE